MTQTLPAPITAAMLTPANANVGKPRYNGMTDWAGGNYGDDVTYASATVALANSSGGANEAAYTPRTQSEKGAMMTPALTIAKDVGVPRGSIAPSQPYPKTGDPAPAAPVVTSLSPTTAPAVQLPLMVTITGTGFTPWSTVYTGGSSLPDAKAVYVSSTTMRVPIWAAVPGTVSVSVKDHDIMSNIDKVFTVT